MDKRTWVSNYVFFNMSKLKPKSSGSPQSKRGGGPMSKQAIYSKVSARGDELIDKLFELTESRNEPIKLGALKTLINKILPDLKVTELQGEVDKLQMGVVILPTLKDEPKVDTTKLDEPSINMAVASGAANTSTPADRV